MKTPLLRLLALFLAFGLVAAACGDDDESDPVAVGEPTGDEMSDDEMSDGEADAMDDEAAADIVATAVASGQFPTLVAALEAADLVGTLQGDGPFTVFAPTEDAFAAALDALGLTADELLADTELLTAVLTYHVVPTQAMAADVAGLDGQEVATVNGATVAISVDGDTVMVNDATVLETDIVASNGVIHVIDTVLLPPS